MRLITSGMPGMACRWKKQSSALPLGQRTSETGRLISSGRDPVADPGIVQGGSSLLGPPAEHLAIGLVTQTKARSASLT